MARLYTTRLGVAGVIVLAALAGCSDPPPTPAKAPVPAPAARREAALGSAKTAWLFDDLAAPRSFRIAVDEADLARMNADPTKEEWVPARVHFEGEVHEQAMVRYKGGYGSLFACFDAEGNQTCDKLSLKVSFNEVDKAGRFYGVRKLVFNSCNRDASCLRERLSYRLFRDAGLVAPRAVHARVAVNDAPESLYLLVENPDKELLEEHFEDPDGDLYKEAWPRFQGAPFYQQALVTNEESSDGARMAELAALLESTDDADLLSALEPWIDLDAMTRYMVTDQMTHNWDGIWKLYCGGGGCGNHNFFLYDDPKSKRLTVIPWDLDHTFGAPNADMGRSWHDDVPCVPEPGGLVDVLPPQCDRLLRALLVLRWDAYRQALAELTAPGAPLSVAHQQQLLDRYRAMILPIVEVDPLGPDPATWRKAAAQLRAIISAQREEAQALLAEP